MCLASQAVGECEGGREGGRGDTQVRRGRAGARALLVR